MQQTPHLTCDGITLLTHIDDLAEHLWFEDLTDVVLVGWSYGAAPAEGVADRTPERVRTVVNLDGGLVRDGEPLGLDGWPDERVKEFASTGWMPAPTSEDLVDTIADPWLRDFVGARERRQPTATRTTPFPESGGRRWQVPHVYLRCTEPPAGEPFTAEDIAEWAAIRSDPRWGARELPLNHLGLLYAPDVVASALMEVL